MSYFTNSRIRWFTGSRIRHLTPSGCGGRGFLRRHLFRPRNGLSGASACGHRSGSPPFAGAPASHGPKRKTHPSPRPAVRCDSLSHIGRAKPPSEVCHCGPQILPYSRKKVDLLATSCVNVQRRN
jgi:hypothetical protein